MKVYVVSILGDRTVGVAASVDLAHEMAESEISDYFGRPIDWSNPYVGKFNDSAYQKGSVIVAEHELVT